MFDFEKLEVYTKAKQFNKSITSFLMELKLDRVSNDQLKRAAFSIMLNIAEGTGRFTNPDKRRFYIIARGSVFECVAILDHLLDTRRIDQDQFTAYYAFLEEISKMLFAMIKGLEVKR